MKDGVVLESEIRKKAAESRFTLTPVDEELSRYKSQVEWRPLQNPRLRFFVMAQHPADYPLRERRRLIRTELERLESAFRKIIDDAKVHGLEVYDGEKGSELRDPGTFSEEEKKRVSGVFDDNYFAAAGISHDEFYAFKLIRADLLRLLGEPLTA